jgi:transposase
MSSYQDDLIHDQTFPRLRNGPILMRRPCLIAEVIDTDPREMGYHSTVWTAPLLREYLEQVHGVVVSRKSVSLAIARLRVRWKRPRHQLSRRPEHWRQSKGG